MPPRRFRPPTGSASAAPGQTSRATPRHFRALAAPPRPGPTARRRRAPHPTPRPPKPRPPPRASPGPRAGLARADPFLPSARSPGRPGRDAGPPTPPAPRLTAAVRGRCAGRATPSLSRAVRSRSPGRHQRRSGSSASARMSLCQQSPGGLDPAGVFLMGRPRRRLWLCRRLRLCHRQGRTTRSAPGVGRLHRPGVVVAGAGRSGRELGQRTERQAAGGSAPASRRSAGGCDAPGCRRAWPGGGSRGPESVRRAPRGTQQRLRQAPGARLYRQAPPGGEGTRRGAPTEGARRFRPPCPRRTSHPLGPAQCPLGQAGVEGLVERGPPCQQSRRRRRRPT